MGSKRQEAKKGVVKRETDDPELDATLFNAHRAQLDLTREANRHTEHMNAQNLGRFGRLAGSDKSAFAAYSAIILGVALFIVCLVLAYNRPDMADFWKTQAERALTFASAALAFLFGKGSSSHS